MSWDIYGNPLRRGYCEVHPDIHQEYPCSVCMAEKQRHEHPHDELEQLKHDFAQQGDYIRHLEAQRNELVAKVEMHRNAEITWEKTMMQAVGEDGPKSVVEAIDAIKAERDSLTAQLLAVTSQRDGLIDELNKTQDEALDARAQRDALAAQVEVVRHAWESVKATDYDRILDEALELTPDACLAHVKAEAATAYGREGYRSAILDHVEFENKDESYRWIESVSDQYAERIRQGGAK